MKDYNRATKVVATILSICLCLVSFMGNYVSAEAADSTTVHFLNSENWDNVYAYVWGDSEALGTWPGTKTQDNGANWNSISVPRGVGFNIIFNNGSDKQSGNVYIDDSSKVYLTMTENASYTSKTDAENAMGFVSSSTRVYFYNSPNWNSVSAYVYGSSEALGSWPGTAAASDGNSWYYIDVPMAASEGFSIIFNDNNNGNQAGDIYISDNTYIYLTADSDTKYASKEDAVESLGGSSDNNENSGSSGTSIPDIKNDVNLSGVGASLPYVEIEAEDAATNGEVLNKSTAYVTDIQSEASGRKAVKLDASGEYVEFTLTESADCMVVRYCMPDGNNGEGLDATLSMYVNGNHDRDLSVTSKYAWVYGEYPFNNDPSSGNGHRFFDDIKVHFGQTYSAGTKIRLQKDSGDTAGYYIVDLADFEVSGSQIQKPDGYLSVTDYGAAANDDTDDYDAFVNCIEQAKSQGKGVYIPAGTFNLKTERTLNVSDVTIRGAGMWHTTLYGAGAAFKVSGTCQFSDFAMTGVSTIRDDSGDLAGFEGYDPTSNVLIQNIWMEHMKVGCWFYNSNGLTIQGCRIRNTYADGINMCSNVHDSLIQNNHLRNTGDDAIAIWPWQGDSNNNTIQYNTVQCPTLANCVAIYGGGNNKVLNNYLADNIAFGTGVNISTNFETPNGFTGTTTVSNNVLMRCGSYEHNLNYERGSIWLFAAMRPITAGVTVSNNDVYDSVYSGVTFDGGFEINNVTFKDNTFDSMNQHAVHVRSSVSGQATFENHVVSNVGGNLIQNDSSNFVVNQSNGGIIEEDSEGLSENVKYRIVCRQSGKCLDIEGKDTGNGANIVQWQSNGGDNQAWTLTKNSDGSYTIKSVLSGKVIDVDGNSKEDGGNIHVWDNKNQDNQKWWLEDVGDGYFSIIGKESGKCLDVEDRSLDNGAEILQWTYNGQSNQQWKFEEVN